MSKELKYKVGDTVIVVAKIDRVDADDDAMSYREGAYGMWFGESDIIGKLPEPEPKAEPEKPRVTISPGGFRGSSGWITGVELKPETKPEPKYAVGDKVIHLHKPEWGAGEVVTIHDNQIIDDYFDNAESTTVKRTSEVYRVKFPHRDWLSSWNCAEENLTPA